MHFIPFAIFGGTSAVVPIGTILPIVNTQAWVPPANGAVKDGFALCNGQTFSGLGAGNYSPAFSGNLPSLQDDRFVMGSTVTATTGGSNGLMLAEANIPRLTSNEQSPVDHYHGVGTQASGGESAPHAHSWGSGPEVNSHGHYMPAGANSSGGGSAYQPVNNQAGEKIVTGGINANHTHSGTSGSSLAVHYHGVSFTTNGVSANHTHTFGGSGQSIDIRPSWVSAVYVMRVS